MTEIWVDKDNHTIPMVCFGSKKDHLVLSPLAAKEYGEKLLSAAQEAYVLIENRIDDALLEKEKADNASEG